MKCKFEITVVFNEDCDYENYKENKIEDTFKNIIKQALGYLHEREGIDLKILRAGAFNSSNFPTQGKMKDKIIKILENELWIYTPCHIYQK